MIQYTLLSLYNIVVISICMEFVTCHQPVAVYVYIGLHQIKPKHTGVALIIGNSYTRKGLTFTECHRQLPALHGALKDTELMKEAFEYLNFFTSVKHNMTQTELISFLYEVKHHNYPKSCQRFVLTFSGHGGDGFIYSEDEKT